jgi:hypothetical protein
MILDIVNIVKNLFSRQETHSNLTGQIINYPEQDPTIQEVIVPTQIPDLPSPCPPFAVRGFTGNPGIQGSVENQAADVFITIVSSLGYVQTHLPQPISHWATLSPLVVLPRAGKMFNAYYDRYTLSFFYDTDPVTNQTIYTADSADVVSHELGHAILDVIRPDLWAAQCVEIQAFHEAFGDINSILTALGHESTVNVMLKQTGGNLHHINLVEEIAEQMGEAIYHAMGGRGPRSQQGLRSAINNFKYTPPETLPTRVPDDGLAGEPHSFSRIFTGAWYDMFVEVYNKYLQNKSPVDSVSLARDTCGKLLFNGIKLAQVTPRFFSSVVRGMMVADRSLGTDCSKIIQDVFTTRNISVPLMMEGAKIRPTNFQSNAVMIKHNMGASVHIGNMDIIRVEEFIKERDNPLYKCLIEVPNQHYLEYNENWQLLHDAPPNMEETIQAAKYSLDMLHEYDKVADGLTEGSTHEREYSLVDGKIIRNYCSCKFNRKEVELL